MYSYHEKYRVVLDHGGMPVCREELRALRDQIDEHLKHPDGLLEVIVVAVCKENHPSMVGQIDPQGFM